MAKKKKRPDIRDVKPTTVIMNIGLKINGGTLSSPEINQVFGAVHRAFAEAAMKCGLGYSWIGEVGCTRPEVMQRTIERQNLHITRQK